MSRIITILFFSVFFVSTGFSQHSWKKLDGPTGARIGGIFVHPNGSFYATVFNNTPNRFLIRSKDQGETWQELPNTPSDFSIVDPVKNGVNTESSFLVFGADGKIVLSVGNTAYVSSDEGNSWTFLKDSIYVFLGAGKPDEYFIRSFSDSLYRTVDGGKSWQNISSAFEFAGHSCYMSWVSGDTYLCWGGGQFGPMMSYDNCTSFSYNMYFYNNQDALEQLTKLPDGEYAGRAGRHVMVGDLNTKRLSFDLPSDIENIGILGANSLAGLQTRNYSYSMHSGYKPQLYLLDSKDQKMINVPAMPPYAYWYPVASTSFNALSNLFAADTHGNILFANGDGLFKTTDNGESWKELPVIYNNVNYIQLDKYGRMFSRQDPVVDFTDGGYNWLRKSEDGGRYWTRISPVDRAYYGIVGPGYDGGIITTSHDSTCQTGMDIWYYGGTETAGWTQLSRVVYPPPGVFGGGPVSADFILVDSADHLYLGANVLYKSEDKGLNWDYLQTDPPVPAQRGAFSPSWKLFIGGQGNKTAATDDGGATWKLLARLPVAPDVIVQSIIAPIGNQVFIGTDKYGIYRSTDAGMSWSKFSGAWGDSITCLAYTKDGTIFIGTPSRGLFSTDLDGKNPVKEPLQLLTDHILTLFVDKGKDVYVGGENSPIWKLTGSSSGVATKAAESSDYSAEMLSSGGSSTLQIDCNKPVTLNITLFNVLGRAIRTFPAKSFSSGNYSVPFDMSACSTGAYFVQLSGEGNSKVISFLH